MGNVNELLVLSCATRSMPCAGSEKLDSVDDCSNFLPDAQRRIHLSHIILSGVQEKVYCDVYDCFSNAQSHITLLGVP